MTRPMIRTENVDTDTARSIRDLFGTYSNAWKKLGLVFTVPYHDFYRALRGQPVTEDMVDTIEDAWREWKRQYLRGFMLGSRDPADWRRLPQHEAEQLNDDHPPERKRA